MNLKDQGRRPGDAERFEVGFVKYVDQETGADKARPAPPAPGDMTRHAKVTDATFHKLHGLFQPSTDPDARAMVKPGRRT